MYLEASLHALKFKAAGGFGGGGSPPPPPPHRICKHNARVMGFKKMLQSNLARLKKAVGLGAGRSPPPHLQTECSHDRLRKHSLKQACAAPKKRGDGSFVLPCLFVSLFPVAVLHDIT